MNTPISRRRPILSLAGLLLSLVAIAAVLLAGIGYRQGWWHFLQGLQIAEWAVYSAALGLVLSLAAAIIARPGRQPRRRGFVTGLLGVLMALPVLGMALLWEVATRTTPPINDISTDTED
ncbi:MAG: NrsF family protein, partial [Hydrogenophaga sp.]|nr:NrsF family protein [Hydrogenophaga sp.]